MNYISKFEGESSLSISFQILHLKYFSISNQMRQRYAKNKKYTRNLIISKKPRKMTIDLLSKSLKMIKLIISMPEIIFSDMPKFSWSHISQQQDYRLVKSFTTTDLSILSLAHWFYFWKRYVIAVSNYFRVYFVLRVWFSIFNYPGNMVDL